MKYTDPTGHAGSDLQYLVPNWFDKSWLEAFRRTHHKEPGDIDYVHRFVTMAFNSGYSGEDVMRSVTIAIGAGLQPSGPDLWSQPVDQTGIQEKRDRWRKSFPGVPDPSEKDDETEYGKGFVEYRWGKVRIITNAQGLKGGFVRILGGGRNNATTFSDNLIVVTFPLDFNKPGDMLVLMHELRHIMQAQEMGLGYLPAYLGYTAIARGSHADHHIELEAWGFANMSGITEYFNIPERWD